MNRIAIVAVAMLTTCLSGCVSDQQSARATRLMAMASSEADQITDPKDRLAALLNIAHTQIGNGRYADGRQSLAKAKATLESPEGAKLDSLTRIAGWVSVSELSRSAEDAATARAACQTAVGVLGGIEPVGQRCEYIRGVAWELYHLDGEKAACGLLRQGGPWAAKIDSADYRRQALTAISSDLFGWDDYDGGKQVLGVDADPAWRSKTLLELARQSMPQKNTWGKSVSYEANFASSKIMPKD